MTWKRWARSYCTAVMLNIAVVGDIATRRSGPAIGIERELQPGSNRFDPREQLQGMVLTVPLEPERHGRTDWHPN